MEEIMDDLLLVGSSQEGDRIAFGSLIDKYYKSIYRFAFQYTGKHHDADEVCQETFLRAFEKIRKLKDGSRFKGWTFMIASNLLRKRAKQTKREKTLDMENPGDFTIKLAEDKSAQPFEILSTKERTTIIHEQLQQMPEHMRLVTILILMEGLSQKDAAGILNRSESSVSRHLDMSRKWLKSRLQKFI
ncbi:MAG: RNA polymerase sigma factor [Planctomycetota bacterium]